MLRVARPRLSVATDRCRERHACSCILPPALLCHVRKVSRASDRAGRGGRAGYNGTNTVQRIPRPIDRESQPQPRRSEGQSLIEQLFPEETRIQREAAQRRREVPRLAVDIKDIDLRPSVKRMRSNPRITEKQRELAKRGEETAVLVLRNASKNLIQDDFQRLIPRGKHVEGWTWDKGNILKVVPGRDLATLERLNYYYLLFNSPLSAYTYQGRATRISQLSSMFTPASLDSNMPPPPGFLSEGEDLQEQLHSYTLTPPSQKLSLRQLSQPLAPIIEMIARHGGYPEISSRTNKAPAEVVIRLEGPTISMSLMRTIFKKAENERRLPWTGDQGGKFTISKWEGPKDHVSPLSRIRGRARARDSEEKLSDPLHDSIMDVSIPAPEEGKEAQRIDEQARRRALNTYIVGLNTEADAESFVRYWHRKSLELADFDFRNGDLAPVVNAEILW